MATIYEKNIVKGELRKNSEKHKTFQQEKPMKL